jgi:hypothetical protein
LAGNTFPCLVLGDTGWVTYHTIACTGLRFRSDPPIRRSRKLLNYPAISRTIHDKPAVRRGLMRAASLNQTRQEWATLSMVPSHDNHLVSCFIEQ